MKRHCKYHIFKIFKWLNIIDKNIIISNVAYGIGKAGVDRLSVDCGIELRKSNVACLGLLLGGVKTELSAQMIAEKGDKAVLKLDPNSFLSVI